MAQRERAGLLAGLERTFKYSAAFSGDMAETAVPTKTPRALVIGSVVFFVVLAVLLLVGGWFFYMTQDITILFGVYLIAAIAVVGYTVVYFVARKA